jgi:hypothetical protein
MKLEPVSRGFVRNPETPALDMKADNLPGKEARHSAILRLWAAAGRLRRDSGRRLCLALDIPLLLPGGKAGSLVLVLSMDRVVAAASTNP